ncbi:hypothetical protein, partial [Enterobacter hormaechei]|uniref:hypothetical protein n=1 Tax=Enterobacter hormaechei TaxID=158836 RepID=UPI00197ADADD
EATRVCLASLLPVNRSAFYPLSRWLRSPKARSSYKRLVPGSRSDPCMPGVTTAREPFCVLSVIPVVAISESAFV